MKANEIRQKFLDYFKDKQHKIVPSAPIVNKGDPTLMFTNAGMNQFKDIFLGNQEPASKRIADTQKCLRVSGKHNDLEEVGIDSYHHTMFEMLGNWSFGDYFKEEAIDWAWELLTDVYGLPADRLYATIFEGEASDGLSEDSEAFNFWKKYLPEERILRFDKKDNFWEMGETGPCGPCSEIHMDLRSDEERKGLDGADLVNADDPDVIEIWNLVFIQFNRKADGSLEELPSKHVDTGMGFERLTMALQKHKSNYASDIFEPLIKKVEEVSGIPYTNIYEQAPKSDIATRVVVDHIRAVAFTIADGELPSNTGAGYVIRRILRRAIRYYYSFLNIKEPFAHTLVPILANQFKDVFPELAAQLDFVSKVVMEEERSFLRTLAEGLQRLDNLKPENGIIEGKVAFELYDTYGFPIDLTRLIGAEKNWKVDEVGFEKALTAQKERSRADAKKSVGDWTVVFDNGETQFVGYDTLEVEQAKILKFRTVETKKGKSIQLVLDKTPFYAEGGGQVGDTGFLKIGAETIKVLDTKKENDLIVHYVDSVPQDFEEGVYARVDERKRRLTENNHTATHLLHAALRSVLGKHVSQKGSLLNENHLRFDFAHFEKVSEEDLKKIEDMVNKKIRENISLREDRHIELENAKTSGAMMLFGEKYGEKVRMITFDSDYSIELCGGCHVDRTGNIGYFKILSESAIAAGVRRIEAVTSDKAIEFIDKELEELTIIRSLFKNPKNTHQVVEQLQNENKTLRKELDQLRAGKASDLKDTLIKGAEKIGDAHFIGVRLPLGDAKTIKNLAFQLEREISNAIIVFGAEVNGKAQLSIMVNQDLSKARDIHAGNLVREVASAINGGGGGQPFFATAGGSKPEGIEQAIEKVKELVSVSLEN